MSSRDFILDRVRRNASSGLSQRSREQAVARRLASPETGILPAQPRTATGRVTRFIEKAEAAMASVDQCSSEGVGAAICEWLRAHNLPQAVRIGGDERLAGLKTGRKHALTILEGPSDGADITCVSHAECGISETGTLVLLSGRDNPTTLNFLPENHIVVLRRSDILPHYEAIWPRLRERFGKGRMPRTVNLVTGPSRSADIEQTLLLGAHGPVRLHIVIVRG